MTKIRQRNILFALLAVVALFAGCKGESPTAPPPTTPGPTTTPPGGVTPPTNANIALTVSNASPVVNSTSTITATVTQDNQPVPNGTAVEFRTNLGVFTDVNGPVTIRTTTGGVATATLTSSTPGTATVTVTVTNVTRTTQVTFGAGPPPPPPAPDIAPAITGISPTSGRPQGGETVTISGRNFRAPVRVLLDLGGGVTREALVTSVTPTAITFVTPAVELGAGQQREVDVILITEAGTPTETRLVAPTKFTFRAERLTPVISAVSPASGPISGGTRTTIFGEGFQAPVQVFFGSAEAQVLNVTFSQIIVMSPTARDTAPDGSGTVTGPVDVRVKNIISNTEATLAAGFRYTPKMQITAVGPTQGAITGGTRVQIDGIGFDDPVTVSIAGIAAQPIRVSGTQIIAVTSPPLVAGCANITGPVVVTNVENGDSATGPTFTYLAPVVTITTITPSTQAAGQTVTVTVLNAPTGTTRFTLGDRTVFPTSATTTGNTTNFTLTLPTTFTFTAVPCVTDTGVPGTRQQPLTVGVTFLNVETGCTTTLANALTVFPPGSTGSPLVAPCVPAPAPTGTVSNSGSCTTPTSCATTTPAAPVATGTATATATITVTNTAATGSQNLSVTPALSGQTNLTTATIAPSNATIAPGASQQFTITVDPAAAGAFCTNVTWTSNASTALPNSCVSGTAAP